MIKMVSSFLALLNLLQVNITGCMRVTTVNTNGNDTQDCLEGDYPCSSLGYVLNHLQSNDCVNITSNSVPLTTIVELHNLNAITIRGQGNTIVMCNNTGGVSCNNCSNVVIEGITWDGCGDPNGRKLIGGVNFSILSNLSLKNCTFQFSKVYALSLRMISSLVEIVNTKFLNNANYEAIYCYSVRHTIKRCVTNSFAVTGGISIITATNATSFIILNCRIHNNGHFGNIKETSNDYFDQLAVREIAEGAGLLFMHRSIKVSVSICIKDTIFSNNRGRSGSAIRINANTYTMIQFDTVLFYKNSVIMWYVSGSAMKITMDCKSYISTESTPSLKLSSCLFYGNSNGRNVLDYFIRGISADVYVHNYTFNNNLHFGFSMIEMLIRSTNMVRISDSNFSDNSGDALIYLHMISDNISFSLFNVKIVNNSGYCISKEGGFIVFAIFRDNILVNISQLYFKNNLYASNGGGLYLIGTFRHTFRCYISSSQFEANVGFGSGTVIYGSLTCETSRTYVMVIDNCIFKDNKGGSIVFVTKMQYFTPAFLILNAKFIHNTGTPVKLFNMILVGKGNVSFQYNQADTGAALYLTDSYLLLNYSSFNFNIVKNFANYHGGGVYVAFRLSNLHHRQCHWLFYPPNNFCSKYVHKIHNCIMSVYTRLFCDHMKHQLAISNIILTNNTALLSGSAIFYQNTYSFNSPNRSSNISDVTSLFHIPTNFIVIPKVNVPLVLATEPWKLKLDGPVNCSKDFNLCKLTGIMLGEKIRLQAMIVGYNNKPAQVTRFYIVCAKNCDNYTIEGGMYVLVNNELKGFSIKGKKVTQNSSVLIQLHSGAINMTLIIDMVPCHLGYIYDERSSQCRCYTTNDVVVCTGVKTTIKKSHWFGIVDGFTTVSLCPNKYCNLVVLR